MELILNHGLIRMRTDKTSDGPIFIRVHPCLPVIDFCFA